MRKITLKIEGMTCTGCERHITEALERLEGVSSVAVSYSRGKATFNAQRSQPTLEAVIAAVEQGDYHVLSARVDGSELYTAQPEGKGKKRAAVNQVLGVGILLLAIYLVVKNTVGWNYLPEINQNMGYGLLFVIGLLTSLHCVAMCGGINISQCASYESKNGPGNSLMPSLLYNGGRVVSYTVIGGIVGALGSVIQFSAMAQGIVAIVAGLFMVVMGLNMLQLFPWLRRITPRMPMALRRLFSGKGAGKGPFYVGLLNGLMPCGPLQAMQLYALGTGSFAAGALSMFLFSLGTVPLMFGIGALSTLMTSRSTQRMLRVCAVLVMVLGVVMVGQGLNVSGINLMPAPTISAENLPENVAKIGSDGVQEVRVTFDSGRYVPIVVQKGVPVRWIINGEKGGLNGCNNPVTIPKYKIRATLDYGENVIEFTPDETGTIVYTCWMGMIRSTITVVDDLSALTQEELPVIDIPDDWEDQQSNLPPCCM